MVAAKASRKRSATGASSVGHEIEGQQHLALDRRAVEGRPRAERGGRGRLGRAARARGLLHESFEFSDGRPEPRGLQPVRGQLRSRGEGGVGIDLEADGGVAGEVGLDQRGADAGEGVQHDARPRRRQVAGQRILHELPRKTRDPGNPPVHRRVPVGHEGGVAEGPAALRPGGGRAHRPLQRGAAPAVRGSGWSSPWSCGPPGRGAPGLRRRAGRSGGSRS